MFGEDYRMTRMVRLRVHFAALGFGVDRLVKPMVSMRADVAVIITKSRGDEARDFLTKCTKMLEDAGIEVEILQCDIWKVSSVVDAVGSVLRAFPDHQYFFNVSTGAKTACIAGTTAGMLWGVVPYYQALDYHGRADPIKEDFPVLGDPQVIPTFEARGLELVDRRALDLIATNGGKMTKQALMAALRSSGEIGAKRGKRITPQAYYGQLRSIVNRLEGWGFIGVQGKGAKSLVVLTEAGEEGAHMFAHETGAKSELRALAV
jgi:hypothetical protein